eukprot:TRINITY_DN7295_c0_g1_i1.p1 TRINITY_DN7295_c0_g1~~TRINITY_DN7295_c0_g1_i1.p1  ORF type:complete len:230 (-),score=23.21 TRINITY_DN7295_c0_g1_i1:15-647(-)
MGGAWSQTPFPLADLPQGPLELILGLLPPDLLSIVARTSKKLHEATTENVWKCSSKHWLGREGGREVTLRHLVYLRYFLLKDFPTWKLSPLFIESLFLPKFKSIAKQSYTLKWIILQDSTSLMTRILNREPLVLPQLNHLRATQMYPTLVGKNVPFLTDLRVTELRVDAGRIDDEVQLVKHPISEEMKKLCRLREVDPMAHFQAFKQCAK